MPTDGQTHQSLPIFWNGPLRRSRRGFVFFYAWAIVCFGAIFAKLALSLELSWILVLAPIWLPALACIGLLLGAMFLDNLRE